MRSTFLALLIWSVILPYLAQAEYTPVSVTERLEKHLASEDRQKLRDELWNDADFPKEIVIDLLKHENPAIRNEALELLEEFTGNDFGYVPLKNPEIAKNVESFQRWKDWAKGAGTVKKQSRELTDEDARRYLSEIMQSNREGFYRAVRRLEPYHLNAVGKIENFIESTPHITDGAKAKLKQAQYQLVLSRTGVGSAPTLARELAFGSRDQKLAGLNSLKGAGLVAIPILSEFIKSEDALIRETALDAMLDVGGSQVLDIVGPVLKAEDDTNVIHIALRKLKDIKGADSVALVSEFLKHEDEDVLISALKVIKGISEGGRDDPFSSGSSKEAPENDNNALILNLLDDKRWRVSSAALEYVEEVKMAQAEDKVVNLLSSDDDFVKASAIKAAVTLKSANAIPVLENILTNEDSNVGIVVQGLVSMQGALTESQIELVESKGVEALIALIDANDDSKAPQTRLVAQYASHKELDVACAALRALADDRKRVAMSFVANILSDALQSGNEEKVQSVLSSLSMPSSSSSSKGLIIGNSSNSAGEQFNNPKLDELYNSFAKLGKALNKQRELAATNNTGGLNGLVIALRELGASTEDMERKMRVTILLSSYGDAETLQALSGRMEELEPSERIAVAKALRSTSSDYGLRALEILLEDDSSEIRGYSSYAFFYSSSNRGLITKGLEYATKPDAKVKAWELYNRNLSYAAQGDEAKRAVANWCRKVIKDSESRVDQKVLALLLLRPSFSSADKESILTLTNSENQLIRRAAWHTLVSGRGFKIKDHQEQILGDKSILVRMALPMALNKKSNGAWIHYFTEVETSQDYYYDYNSRNISLSSTAEKLLRMLADTDVSEQVQYESLFTLLCYGKEIELNKFIDLLVKQPDSSKAEERIINFVEGNYKTMGRGLAPLIGYIDLRKIQGRYRDAVIRHFYGSESKAAFSSFGDLAKSVEKIEELPQFVEPAKVSADAPERESIRLVYFYEKGCKECQRVEEEVFPKYKEEFKKISELELIIDKYDINKSEGGVYNRALVSRLDVPKARGKKPAIFTQVGVVIERDITMPSLMDMTTRVIDLPASEEWHTISKEQTIEAKEEIQEEYNSLTLPIVIIAGLIDGINPCAFATIIFFLSYLQIAKRSPREIFFVGCAFILGVFIAYFSIGLIFHSIIGALTSKFAGVKTVLNYVFALIALVVAYFSFKDYLKARKGNLKEMTLQLPGALKNQVRSVIRKSSKSTYFVIAAFVTGLVISFIELACTGQVYAPIIYQIQQGNHDAVFYLLAFNVAFVLPLIVIFLFAISGMKSQALISFQQKHTATIKLIFTILFVLLALMLLFNDQFSGWFIHLKSLIGLDQLGGS